MSSNSSQNRHVARGICTSFSLIVCHELGVGTWEVGSLVNDILHFCLSRPGPICAPPRFGPELIIKDTLIDFRKSRPGLVGPESGVAKYGQKHGQARPTKNTSNTTEIWPD